MSQKPEDKNQAPLNSSLEKPFMEARTVLIFDEINMQHAKKVISEIIAFSKLSEDPINLLINSPGGHVEAGYAICDIIGALPNKINVIGSGYVASIAAVIYLSVPLECRYSFESTRYLLHQPLGGAQGVADDIEIQAKEIIKAREKINKFIAIATNQNIAKVTQDTDRDFWLDAEQAIAYGMVYKIIHKLSEMD